MRKIYWYCMGLSKSDEKFLVAALNELVCNLRKPPVEIELAVETLSEPLVARICPHVSDPGEFTLIATTIGDEVAQELPPKHTGFVPGLLIYCRGNDQLAQSAQKANPTAEWGATCGRLAVVWTSGNEKLIWHEALHLLGVTDCYDKETLEGSCEKEPGCLMQYAPTDETVAEWPDCLCLGTVDELRSPRGRRLLDRTGQPLGP